MMRRKKKFKKHNFNIREKKGLCYIEEHTFEDEVDDDSNEESLFLAIEDKEDALKKPKEEGTVKAALHAKIKLSTWIIDSRCSNHMIGDKDKFINLNKYDGGSVKFVGEDGTTIRGIRSVSIDGKHKTDDVYYVEGLRHSLLSMSQMCIKGYEVLFSGSGCVIRKEKTGKRVSEGVRTCGNVYCIKDRKENKCLLAQKVEIVLAAPEKTSDPKKSKEKETNDEEEEEDSTKIPTKYVQKHHFKNQIIEDKTKAVQTRRKIVKAQEQANYCFLSMTQPKTYEEASKDESWVKAMEEKLNQIQKNKT